MMMQPGMGAYGVLAIIGFGLGLLKEIFSVILLFQLIRITAMILKDRGIKLISSQKTVEREVLEDIVEDEEEI